MLQARCMIPSYVICFAERDDVSRISKGVQAIDLSRERGLGSDAGESGESADSEDLPDAGASAAAEQQQESEDEGEWETAASSKNAARRKKRKVRCCRCSVDQLPPLCLAVGLHRQV